MMEDIELEDLAMGVMPKKAPEKAKLTTATKSKIKDIVAIIKGIEDMSISDYKVMKMADKKALKKAYDELGDMCYTAKNLIREACSPEEMKNMRGSMGIKIMSDDD